MEGCTHRITVIPNGTVEVMEFITRQPTTTAVTMHLNTLQHMAIQVQETNRLKIQVECITVLRLTGLRVKRVVQVLRHLLIITTTRVQITNINAVREEDPMDLQEIVRTMVTNLLEVLLLDRVAMVLPQEAVAEEAIHREAFRAVVLGDVRTKSL